MRKITPEYKEKIAEQWACVCEAEARVQKTAITSAQTVIDICADLKPKRKEYFVVLTLDGANQLIKKHVISIGTTNKTLTSPRDVFYPAIKDMATAIIVVHNHPSGKCEPSREDKEVTKRLVESGTILGIQVLDHVIVANDYYSFNENGLI